ncbi:Pre-mRNA-processing protein 40A [Raphanus sativus]|uniref:Pre-mRNA-processing protein 40A isoform X2 n=1 Tax=Raphanus sativus TaxID=3726 RepID=A0A6J0JQK5_RAPSA|nr:pre-mRNA-processing protein 40A isoform X2 [Raphanus sativus]KAJ4917361.1 Pre-mRNA-processing protein 40A [Raphanus sativus]
MSNNLPQSSGAQFRPMVPGQQFVPAASQPFHHPYGHVPPNVQSQQLFPVRPGQPGQSQPNAPPLVGFGTSGPPFSSSYTFAPASYGQQQPPSLVQPTPQMHASGSVPPPANSWPAPVVSQSTTLVSPVQQTSQQTPATPTDPGSLTPQSASDWMEHTSADGRKYYYNKQTKQSSWEKPLELMTPLERADASTVWKEFTTAEGRKYYYNKVTKESKWTIPEDLKLAREQAELASAKRPHSEPGSTSLSHVAASSSDLAVSTPVTASMSPTIPAHSSSPIPAGLAVPVTRPPPAASVTPKSAATSDSEATAMKMDNLPSQGAYESNDGAPAPNNEVDNKEMSVNGKSNMTAAGDKANVEEPMMYATKQEAKAAFKSLLESVNVQSDWTWEQTTKEIVHDKRYGALRTLGERKQAFNEYLGQRKKVEAEERRWRQKKAREEFVKMLEECEELSSSLKWSKALSLFENDERFKAVDRPRDREDLFDNYIVELERKEREKAVAEHRQKMAEYRKFLETCDYIKASTQWRKIQDRLEDDERSASLEKIDRLIGFEDYINDLEKEEEELKRVEKEHVRRAERKNRDAFRTLLEEHVAAGILTAKTYWLEYCIEVRDLPQYQAVASNLSGSTPKDLFEDITEELEKQYHEDKSRVKDAMKSRKVSMVASWMFEDFKSALSEDLSSQPISDINLKLIYNDMVERMKEKEEKEARKLQRLAEEFTNLLRTFKEITAASNWEDVKQLVEESQEYRSIGDDNVSRGLFEEYIASLQEKAKEKERKRDEEKSRKEKDREEKEKRKDKEKERREKEREREKERSSKREESDGDTVDVSEGHKEEKRKGKDRDRKHRRRHHNSDEDVSSDRDDREESKKSSSRKHGSNDRKKSRKHANTPESDSESRHKRQKKEQRESSRRGGNDELEDGEVGEDGEIKL